MQRRPRTLTTLSVTGLMFAALAGCQTSEPAGGPLSAQVQGTSPVSTLQRINDQALRCWIQSGDSAFAGLALVPELDSLANDPRILIVRRGQAQGLPQLVITASDAPVQLSTFGPLTRQGLSNRINADLTAWSAGATGCGTRT